MSEAGKAMRRSAGLLSVAVRRMPRHGRWIMTFTLAVGIGGFKGANVSAQTAAPLREVLVEVEGDRQRGDELQEQNLHEPTVDNLDQWVFQRPAQEASENYDHLIQLEIERIDRVCDLSPEQSRLLQLAGEGEKQRIRDALQVMHAKYADRKFDRNLVGQIFQAVQPLQTQAYRQPLAKSSMVVQTLGSILDEEQSARWAEWRRERQRKRLRREIDAAVAKIEQHVPLRSDQRDSLVELLAAEVRLVGEQSEGDNVVAARMVSDAVLAQMNGIAAESFQAFLEPPQWEAMQEVFTPHRGQLRMLQGRGLLIEREEGQ